MTRQEELEAMSDFRLCETLSDLLDISWLMRPSHRLNDSGIWRYSNMDTVDTCESLADYCNNPNDIMPLAIENKISTTFNIACPDLGWEVSGYEYLPPDDFKEFRARHESLYRAICIVLILMKESEL